MNGRAGIGWARLLIPLVGLIVLLFTTEQAVAVSLLGNEYLALASGYEGIVIDYDSGARISGVRIVFESVDGSVREVAYSDGNGWYSIDLPVNSYRVRASHADYRDYSTGSGLFVVPKQEMYTGNITMWPRTHVGAPYRTKAAPPGPPTVSISVSAPKVAAGQAFSVYLEGTDDNDISSIWWWGHQTGDDELDKAHWHDCGGGPTCQQQWTVSVDVEGIHYLCANARDAAYYSHDGQAHQASEGMGIPCAEIEIVPAGSVIPSLSVAEDLQIVIPEIGIFEAPAVEDDVQIVVDGSGVIEGPLPVVFYALTDSSGRFYPLNGGSEHNTLFGLYDSGATSLFINGLKPRIVERSDGQRELLNGNRVGGVNWEDSDAGHLNVSTGERVNIRLTGVQTQQGNRNPPVRTPGSPDGAQVEVSNLIVKKEDGLNVTLVGAPVINQLVAHLDYTNLADSSWLTYVNQSFHVGVDTPSIDLFWPGDPGIPASDLTLPLEQFGVVTSRSEKRFQLPNVDFTNGRRTVTNWAGDYRYLFDTGSTMTIVSDLIAGELGLAQMTSDFDCLGGRDNGFFIDSVTMHGIAMHGIGGAYQVDNASVCWHQDKVKSVDAVIGSNLFEQVALILDGPNSLLGIRVGEHAQAPDVPENSVPENDPPENNETQSVPEQNSEQENASLSGLYDTIMAKVSASSQKNEYKYETELFVRHLAAYLSATHSTGGQDHAAVIDALLHQSDVGDRINALVHRTWKDWMAYGLDHMTADPGQNGQTPLRQLVIRLSQGSHGQLSATDLRALHNCLTRSWDGDIRGLIGAVNRDVYGW